MTVQVAVCGPGECSPAEARQAREVGELLAVSLGGWRVTGADGSPIDGIRYVSTPAEAVDALR